MTAIQFRLDRETPKKSGKTAHLLSAFVLLIRSQPVRFARKARETPTVPVFRPFLPVDETSPGGTNGVVPGPSSSGFRQVDGPEDPRSKKDQQGSNVMAKKKKKITKRPAAKKKTVRKAAAKKTTRKTVAKKTATKKKTTTRATKASPTIKGSVAPRTKSQIFNTIAEATEMSRKEVTAVVSTLESMMVADLKKGTAVKFMGMKMTVKKKPATKARKGRNPFTGEDMMFKAKPASKAVKVRALKTLNDQI